MNDVATARRGGGADAAAPARFGSVGDGLAAAEAARARGDATAALQFLTELREAFPDHPVPILRAASVLSQLRRFDDAEALLADGATRFPADAGFAIERAWTAQRRGDLAEATARFARVRQDVPNHPAGFTGGALALRDGGDFAGAEALLDEAMQRFPDEPGPVIDYAWVAHMRRDWPEAALRWQRVRERCATYPVGYTAGAAAQRELGRLDDAAALLEMAVARFPAEPGPLVEHAWFANHRRDWQAAIGLWEAVRRRFPAQIAAYIGGAQALREAGRLGDADALLATATERFPNDPGVRIEHAALASRRREWLEAAGRWDQVRARFPDHPASYTGAAQALREQRRFAEAGAVLEEALQRFPGDPGVRSEYAWLAQIAGDWPEATRRWQEMRERHPDHAVGYTSGAVSLREQRRFDEAEALLAEALVRFPGERVPLVEHAWLATSRRDWALAARRWEEVRRRHPELAEGYLRGAQALATMWQHEAAETLLAEGMTRFPQEGAFATEYAWIAYHRHEFEDAVRRFAELRDRFPAIIAGYTGGAMALRNLFRLGEAEALLEEAARRFPDDPKIPFEHAQLPMFHPLRRERDPEEALRRLAALRERFPDFEEGYVVALRYLREADRSAEGDTLAEAGLARLPGGAALVVEYSNNARERADWAEAVRRFETARSRFPGDPGGAIGLAASLSAAGRHDEAEQVAREATERFPSVPAAFNEFAWAAARRDDWAMALARWTEAQRHFPDEQDFAHRIFEARLRLAEGPDRAEPSGRVFRPKLRDVHHGKKMDDEIRQILRRRAFDRLYWPHRAVVVVDGHAELYDEASRVIGADTRVTVLEFGVAHGRSMQMFVDRFRSDESAFFGFDSFVGLPEAWLMHEAGAFTRHGRPPAIADQRLSFVNGWFQNTVPEFFRDFRTESDCTYLIHFDADLYSSTLFLLGQIWDHVHEYYFIMDDFGQEDINALFDFASAYPIEIEFIAQTRGPGDPSGPDQVFGRMRRVEYHSLELDGEPASRMLDDTAVAPADASAAPAAETDPRAAMREIVMQFESLGGTALGCEFGMFQREFGAEPLGLLRWADMPYDGAIFALENRFDGVGSAEHTELFVNRENSRPEYCTRDRRGFMFMRAFIYEDEMSYERMWKQALRRLGYLKDKLIGDLENGSKIFIYRLTNRNLEPDELTRLHAAARSYGDNMLLYVRYEDAEHPNGTVELAAPGLMIGYIDRFKMSPDGQLAANPPSASWMAICARAHALWQEHSAIVAATAA